MRNFTIEDFTGAGQYLIRNDKPAGQYIDPGFMSTIMYKVGFMINNLDIGSGGQITTMTSMADGMTSMYNYVDPSPSKSGNWDKVIWQNDVIGDHKGIQRFVDWLNNPELSQEYRLATQEEVVRVVMYQKSRWK